MSITHTLTQATLNFAKTATANSAPVTPTAPESTESPAATFQPSSSCVLADQQQALKNLRVGAASSEWTVAYSGETSQATASRRIKGQPNNWASIKQNMTQYLQGAQQREACQRFEVPSKGHMNLDRSGDPNSATAGIAEYLPPGCLTVSIHGIAPIDRTTGKINPTRNEAPFWDGTDRTFFKPNADRVRTADHVVDLIGPLLEKDCEAPIFLNSCNAGTNSEGFVPAADLAKQTGRFVIAPADSRILSTARGPQLNDKGGEWRTFHPDGTSELLYKPEQYPPAR